MKKLLALLFHYLRSPVAAVAAPMMAITLETVTTTVRQD